VIALGNPYIQGLGVHRDQSKGFELCRKSAEHGVPDAETDLGQMYLTGQGVERDPMLAAQWLQKATDSGQGNEMLLYDLARSS
jgi:TPR repeat protein